MGLSKIIFLRKEEKKKGRKEKKEDERPYTACSVQCTGHISCVRAIFHCVWC